MTPSLPNPTSGSHFILGRSRPSLSTAANDPAPRAPRRAPRAPGLHTPKQSVPTGIATKIVQADRSRVPTNLVRWRDTVVTWALVRRRATTACMDEPGCRCSQPNDFTSTRQILLDRSTMIFIQSCRDRRYCTEDATNHPIVLAPSGYSRRQPATSSHEPGCVASGQS